MTDAPASALAAAESAIIEAATDFGHDDILCGSSRQFARAALEAASPLLAEAWGAFECEPLRTEGATAETEWGVDCTDGRGEHRVNFGDSKYGSEDGARAMIDRDQRNGIGAHNVLVRRTVTYGPWEAAPVPPEGKEP